MTSKVDGTNRQQFPETPAVLIAGAGPTGLMLAAELALARVDVAIVERRESHDLEGLRAGGLHPRTLEVLDQRGVAHRFLSAGQIHRQAPFFGDILDRPHLPTRHNYFLVLWQTRIESILAAWVEELGVPIYRGIEVTDFLQHDNGVHVSLSAGRSVHAQYLVGCDGGRSLIRKKAGIGFPGWDASHSYLIAEIETAEEPAWGLRHGEHGKTAIAKLQDAHHARVVLSEPNLPHPAAPTTEDVRQALLAVYGTDYGLHSASYVSRFTDMARQSSAYRAGRVLLAGDAAHVHSPVGGQGLNIGVQDAVNLGWKLARVVHGTSPQSLLDTYHAERHPVGARLLRNTMALTAIERPDDRVDALRDMLAELLQGHQARQQYFAMMSGLDVHYDLGNGHPLLGRRMPDLDLTTATGPTPVYALLHSAQPLLLNFGAPLALDIHPLTSRVSSLDAQYHGTWELPALGEAPAPGAVLIRPDGHVAWVGDSTCQGLDEALTTWCGPPPGAHTY